LEKFKWKMENCGVNSSLTKQGKVYLIVRKTKSTFTFFFQEYSVHHILIVFIVGLLHYLIQLSERNVVKYLNLQVMNKI